MSRKKAILVDLDGTLANCDHRVKYLMKEPKEWNSFYEGLGQDSLNLWCLELMNAMNKQGVISIIVTGRDEHYLQQTSKWLEQHNVDYHQLFMRKKNSKIEDSEVKKEIYNIHIKDNYDVRFVLDDRLSVVKMWRDLGLTCLQCDWGEF